MKPRTVAVVQARMGSKRFPGKMLAPLGGRPLLEWVLRRTSRAASLDGVVLATSDQPADDALERLASALGVPVYRGDEDNVLARFVGAARASSAGRVVRICADNPFVAPEELDRLVRVFSEGRCDYACNHQDRLGSGYADGLGAEIFNAGLLERIEPLADARQREHVTLYLWDHADEFRLAALPAPGPLAHPELRFDVNEPADLEYLETLAQDGIAVETAAAGIVARALRSVR
jgi:spore coat polysaccharide biosynthesis protein SpsF